MTIRRAPLPARPAAAACDAPPRDIGRLRRSRHPVFATVFLAAVGAAMSWGALRAPQPVPALAVAFAAAGLCVVAGVVALDGTRTAHALTKLGWSRPRRSALLVGVAAAGAGAALALATRPVRSDAVTSGLLAGTAALWFETFCRGFVQRSWSDRHSALLALAVAALVQVGLAVPMTLAPAGAGGRIAFLLAELAMAGAAGLGFALGLGVVPGFAAHTGGLWAALVAAHPAPLGVAAGVFWGYVALASRRRRRAEISG